MLNSMSYDVKSIKNRIFAVKKSRFSNLFHNVIMDFIM